MRKSVWMLVIASFLIISLAACGAAPKQGNAEQSPAASAVPSPETNEAYVKAAELFKKTISCHGVDLSGRVGPTTNLQKVGASMTKEQITNQIHNGGGGMPAYQAKLTADEIDLLAVWLSSKK
jgi:cytochrome c551